jgi:hypothetical protein
MTSDPAVSVLPDGKAGMANQAIGVADAAGYPFIATGLGRPFRRRIVLRRLEHRP